jgi:hypothetical protein
MPINARKECLETGTTVVDLKFFKQLTVTATDRHLMEPAAYVYRYPKRIHHLTLQKQKRQNSSGVLSILEATARRLASSTADVSDDAVVARAAFQS